MKKMILAAVPLLVSAAFAACSGNVANSANMAISAPTVTYSEPAAANIINKPVIYNEPASVLPGKAMSANPALNIVNAAQPSGVIQATSTPERELSRFSTKFNQKQTGRVTNITLATQKINGKVIQPGETFSYNETVGPTGKKHGYKRATIFVKGEKKLSYGGGVCQVSSTLYNAALDAGFEIVERHPHSGKVAYVPKDKDAATSYGGIDFKFKNNQERPVKVEASVADGSIMVALKAI